SGTVQSGQTLTATPSGFNLGTPTATYSYQWTWSTTSTGTYSNIAGATASTYVVESAYVNDYLKVVITATNTCSSGCGSASASSAATSQVLPAAPTGGSVSVSGSAQVGSTLSATACSAQGWSPSSPAPSCAFQWQVSADGTSGWTSATGAGNATSSYIVAAADYNQYLRVQVTATNPGGSGTASSAATSQVQNPVNGPSRSLFLVDGQQRAQYGAQWRADETIAYVDDTNDVYDGNPVVAADADGSNPKPLIDQAAGVNEYAVEGSRVVWYDGDSIYTRVGDGDPVLLATGVDSASGLTLSPDGGHVAWYSVWWEDSVWEIATDGSDSAPHDLTGPVAAANWTDLTWNPAGTKLVFTTGWEIDSVDLEGNVSTLVTAGDYVSFSAPSWGPSGQIAYWEYHADAFTTDLRLVDSDGNNARTLGSWSWGGPVNAESAPGLVWSPDGREIAFAPNKNYSQNVGGGLYLVNVESADVTNLLADVSPEADDVHGCEDQPNDYGFSPAGDAIVYAAGDTNSPFGTPCQVWITRGSPLEPTPIAPPDQSWSDGGGNDAAPGVDPAPDDYTQTSTDASITSYGPPLSFSRTYDSFLAQAQATAGTPGPLGYGWTDNWDMSLSANAGTVTINQGDGAAVSFHAPTNGACDSPYIGSGDPGTYCALPDVTGSLNYDSATSTYTFLTHPYANYTFNSSGQLTSESGPGGATLSLAYNSPAPGSGNCPSSAASCMTITSASGRALVIGSNSSNRITSVTDPLGRNWTYGYCSPPSSTCSSGDLVSVTDPRGKVTSYTYDQGNSNSSLTHDLLTVTKPNGQPGGPDAGAALVNVYNSSGQLTSQTDPDGNQTTYDYSHLDASGTGYTLTTDPDGIQTEDTYDNHALINETVGYGDASASTSTYRRDPATLLDNSVIDGNGNRTDFGYNNNGLVGSRTDPLGQTTTYSYNAFDEPTCVATAQAAQPCSSLSPPTAISPGGTISPPSSAPPAYVTYYQYDTHGDLIWTTAGAYAPGSSQPNQQRTTYNLYAGESIAIGTTNDSCNATPSDSSLPCATIDPNGVVTQLQYNSAGDVTSSAAPDGNGGGEIAQTTYGYNGDGEQTSTTTPNGNLSGATAGDYTTTTGYNPDGQVTSTTVGQPGGNVTPRTTTYGYDDNGNRTSVTDPRNKTTNTRYDANDQAVLVTDPDGNATLTCYDGAGNVTETVSPVGVAANSLTPASCPTSYPAGYGDRLAADATTYTYNDLGEKTAMSTPAAGRADGLRDD
ncbi:MAG TPA: DUF6531 domain-containing protein, partial [Gaiellaceae bacterium]|nr:DUF6531 domain-containing protein [Gaiellaceae bacterium]